MCYVIFYILLYETIPLSTSTVGKKFSINIIRHVKTLVGSTTHRKRDSVIDHDVWVCTCVMPITVEEKHELED